MLVHIILYDVDSKWARVGTKVRWQQAGAYDVNAQEVADYAQQLAKDMREAGVDMVVVELDEDHTSTTGRDICLEWILSESMSKSINQESEVAQDKGEEEEKEDVYKYSQKYMERNQDEQMDHVGQELGL